MKFRKKPVEIDAFYFNDLNSYLEICDFAKSRGVDIYKTFEYTTNKMFIQTLEGKMEASAGDWIICGVNGEFYPCKPDVFAKTYERVGMQHIESKECWCEPVMYYKDEKTGIECWSHNEAGKQ